jgi:hypothetical protein
MLANTNKLYHPAVTENLCIISIFISPLAASPKRIKKKKEKGKQPQEHIAVIWT